MEIVYSVARQFTPSHDLATLRSDIEAQIQTAETAGFDGVKCGEHHVTDDTYLNNEAVLAFAAPLAGDMHIATGICLLPYHSPVRIAEYGATMDVLTEGRFRLGVGQGYRPEEFAVFGIQKSEVAGRLQECIEVIKELWTSESVTYSGTYYEYDDISINPKPLQEPRPPIIVAASNENTVRRAAKIGDGWWASHVQFDILKEYVEAFREESPGGILGLSRGVFVAETDEKADALAKEPLMEKYNGYVEWGQSDVFDEDTFEREWEELKEDRFIIGSPETVISEIERYQSAFDLDFLAVKFQEPMMTFEDVRSSVELFGEKIIPYFN